MRDLERVAHDAAARAGAMLRARQGEGHQVAFKSEVDLVTAVDRDAETLIVGAIRSAFPSHTIVAEESAPGGPSARGYCWYVDPIDGTTNFAHAFPHFAVSIALELDGDPLLGVVYDPMRDELFTAAKNLQAPYDLVRQVAEAGRLPVVNFAAGGVATPADAALLMQLGVGGIFVGSGIFKSGDPARRARAIVEATTHYNDPEVIAEVSKGLGEPMVGIEISATPNEQLMAGRGW